MDDTAFTTDQLRALFESLPTSEEVELISRYDGDVHFLAPPETYMRVMSDVVHIAAPRIQVNKHCINAMELGFLVLGMLTCCVLSVDDLSAAICIASCGLHFSRLRHGESM
jgi:hypothetical protein